MNNKYEFVVDGWQSWAVLVFAVIGFVEVLRGISVLIAKVIY